VSPSFRLDSQARPMPVYPGGAGVVSALHDEAMLLKES
jgi:hypothetical protein